MAYGLQSLRAPKAYGLHCALPAAGSGSSRGSSLRPCRRPPLGALGAQRRSRFASCVSVLSHSARARALGQRAPRSQLFLHGCFPLATLAGSLATLGRCRRPRCGLGRLLARPAGASATAYRCPSRGLLHRVLVSGASFGRGARFSRVLACGSPPARSSSRGSPVPSLRGPLLRRAARRGSRLATLGTAVPPAAAAFLSRYAAAFSRVGLPFPHG